MRLAPVLFLLACAVDAPAESPSFDRDLAEPPAEPAPPPPTRISTWSHTPGADAVDAAYDSDGNLIVGLANRIPWDWGDRLWVSKLDPAGNELWSTVDDYVAGGLTEVRAVAVDSQDNVLVAGVYNRYEIWLGKFDPLGNELWVRTVTETELTGTYGPFDVAVGPDDEVVVVGAKAEDWYIARYLPDGTLDWSRNEGPTSAVNLFVEHLSDVVVAPDGTIVTCGRDHDGYTYSAYNEWVLRAFDSAGGTAWTWGSGNVNYTPPTGCNGLALYGGAAWAVGEILGTMNLKSFDIATGAPGLSGSLGGRAPAGLAAGSGRMLIVGREDSGGHPWMIEPAAGIASERIGWTSTDWVNGAVMHPSGTSIVAFGQDALDDAFALEVPL